MSAKAFIVVGLGFGDEGKGLATDYLCCQTKNSLVIRFNGGHQAGHTVVTPTGKRHVFSNFGAGTLRGVPTYWSNYCTFSPGSFLKEYKGLQELEVKPVLYVDKLCPVTTHYDVLYNQIMEEERGKAKHGSCGLGFGTTIERHHFSPVKLYAQDLLYPEICMLKLKAIRQYYQLKIKSASSISFETLNHEAEDQRFYQYIQSIDKLNKESVIHFISGQEMFSYPYPWENFIFEGAQGVLLDMDFGFFPHVTRSNTTSKNAIKLIDSHLKDRLSGVDIFYVSRAYQTRHGDGPMTYEGNTIKLINNENETNQYNKYQGNFRVSALDIDLLQYALECDNNFSYGLQKNLLITCLDQLEDKLIPCYKDNCSQIISHSVLAEMLLNSFNQSLFSFSNCAENLV